jgi:hypothetical protein
MINMITILENILSAINKRGGLGPAPEIIIATKILMRRDKSRDYTFINSDWLNIAHDVKSRICSTNMDIVPVRVATSRRHCPYSPMVIEYLFKYQIRQRL